MAWNTATCPMRGAPMEADVVAREVVRVGLVHADGQGGGEFQGFG
jgi:hypothetical protein